MVSYFAAILEAQAQPESKTFSSLEKIDLATPAGQNEGSVQHGYFGLGS